MPDFRGLETFYWVVMLGSFGKAARRLNTTQPAVSQRISALEGRLGCRLLTRGARQAVVTPSGRELLVYVEKLLRLRAELVERFSDRTRVQGVLRLGVAETIVHTWLPAFIKAVKTTYPDLAIEIEVDISPSLRQRLLAQEIDLAFLIGPLTASTLRNLSLGTYRLGFFASPALAVGRRASLAEIARHPIITFSRRTQPYETLRELFQRTDLPPVTLNASASLSTVVRLAVEGLGIAVVPAAIVAMEVAEGRLREVVTDAVLPDLVFSASWLATPDAGANEAVAKLAAEIARETSRRSASKMVNRKRPVVR
jgi:DNA-binding transcriptional LysR family regulator